VHRSKARSRAATLIAVLALLLSACSGAANHKSLPRPSLSPSPLQPAQSGSPLSQEPGLARYYRQQVVWKPCRGGDQCTRISVPLDYAHPAGKAISLAVLKVPAQDKQQRVGALVVNPGGPGVSGISYAANTSAFFGPELQQAFDIVGFDPRGVGESTPVQCLSNGQLDKFVSSDPDPDTPAEINASDRMVAQLGRGCVKDSGALAAHISTPEAARDMDILRAALGQRKLTYFGASYGTFLGATYAELFPKRVGRMVLDGAIDPAASSLQTNLVQAHGFEVALRSYVANCVNRGGCYLGSTVDQGIARIQKFLRDVEAKPLPGSGGRQLTIGLAVPGIWLPLYNRDYWPYLDSALRSAFGGQGAQLLMLADSYNERGPNGYNNSLEALYAINCLDHDDSIPSQKVPSYFPRFEKASPTFGRIFAFGLSTCSKWPIHTGHKPAPIHTSGTPPILVVGTTRDPATPLAWARSLAHQISSAILVTRNGDGHTGYHAGNQCVDNTVESYLVSDKVPTGQVNC
jgi:pimeloyl-ACP methyl ester carboxylesterase